MNKILGFIVLIAIGMLYEKYKENKENKVQSNKKHIIKQYFFKNKHTFDNKPFLWLHNDHDINSRKWLDFGSRNTNNINRPYITICLDKLIKTYSDYFNVVIIDDVSFNILLPNKTNISTLPEPLKTHERKIALVELIYKYGGIVCPNSFYPKDDTLIDIYKNNECFSFEILTGYKTNDVMIPSVDFIGCKKKNPNVKSFIEAIRTTNKNDVTNQQDFLEATNMRLNKMKTEHQMVVYDGRMIGTKYKDNTLVTLDDLVKEKHNDFHCSNFGLYIPKVRLEKITSRNWITYLSKQELLNSNTLIGSYFNLYK